MKKDVFIQKANSKHSILYSYDRVLDWINTQDKEYIQIGCPNCNEYFRVRYDSFLAGSDCKKCKKTGRKVTSLEEFIERAKLVHGDKYTYEKVVPFKDQTEIVIIHCPIHGDFKQSPAHHLAGSGCKFCKREEQTYKTADFLKEAELAFPNQFTFDIDSDFLPADKLFTVTCKFCGNSFKTYRRDFLGSSGCKCCSDSRWIGEDRIRKFLLLKGVNFKTNKTFPDLKDREALSYDIYVENRKLLIEYNGSQHYEFNSWYHVSEQDFHRQLHHDWLKRKYARDHNINLEVISYKDKRKIPQLLEEILKKYPEN